MHEGRFAEFGPPNTVTQSPQSDITKQLLDDIPDVHRDWLRREPPVAPTCA